MPVELLGRTAFPPIGDPAYRLTLPGYGFYWLALAAAGELAGWHQPTTEPLPEFITIVLARQLARHQREPRRPRPRPAGAAGILPKQSWFEGPAPWKECAWRAPARCADGSGNYLLTELAVEPDGATQQCFFLPFAAAWGEENLAPGAPLLPYTLARVRRGPKVGALYDATHADDFARTLSG